jgi:hypothetical protein
MKSDHNFVGRVMNSFAGATLFATSPPAPSSRLFFGLSKGQFVDGLANYCMFCHFCESAMPRKFRFVPWVTAAGAVRDESRSVQKRGGQVAIETTLEVETVLDVLARAAMNEEARPGGTPLLALLGIESEPLTRSRIADGKIEAVAEPDAERSIRSAGTLGPIIVLAGSPLQRWR